MFPSPEKILKFLEVIMKLFKRLIPAVLLLPVIAWSQTNIQIQNAYIRELPPNVETVAVYMTLNNSGQHALTLTEIRTDAAASAMLHLSSMQNGMMVMEHITNLEIPPGESVSLEPGSFHIMLEGLRQSVRAGDSVEIRLHFSNGLVLAHDVPIIRNSN
tara:strand:- start:18933 stop:19409 length:477 start_codon:yes stop_codon:yes gene_type:complete